MASCEELAPQQYVCTTLSLLSRHLVTLHAHARAGGYVIGAGVHIYMFVDEKNYLNHTLAIDSPFQIFTVGLLVEFID